MHLDLDEDGTNCECCGAAVSHQFARVFGDQDGTVHRCQDCDTRGRIASGSAAGRETVRSDPLNNPGDLGKSRENIPQPVRALIGGDD